MYLDLFERYLILLATGSLRTTEFFNKRRKQFKMSSPTDHGTYQKKFEA
jgi:hypothetical protein